MDTMNSLEIFTIYEYTMVILSTGSFIMGLTLLIFRSVLKNTTTLRLKSGLLYLALALFVISVANFSEYAVGVDRLREDYSLSIVVFVASMELFLIFTAYMSILSGKSMTKRRIYFELGCIALFAAPICIVSPKDYPFLFDLLFVVGIVFYSIKLTWNFLEYRMQMRETKTKIINFISEESRVWLKWINNTFYVLLTIGVVSVIVPMTNMTVLVFYNAFLFFAYFYVYVFVIQNIAIFDGRMALLEGNEVESDPINEEH